MKGLVITSVMEDSIASEMKLAPGDRVAAVNGQEIRDVIDFRYFTAEDVFTLLVQKADDEVWELEIEREPGERLGIEFEQIAADGLKTCKNHCLFCFVAQMPHGLRRSLYDRDDDYRLSLTQGSFITLSNLSEQEFQRIIAWRLSPLYISVHAWDPETRARLMGCRAAGKLPEQMQRLAAAGLTLHAQIVVLPEMNDGDCLRQTILNLRALYPAVQSIGVVPVGLTQYRQGLTPLRGFTAEEAASILAQGQEWQAAWRAETGRSIVYYADEFYVLAGWDFPPPPIYDDFAQLENGIGMASKFSAEIEAVWPFLPEKVQSRRVHLLTGTSAAGYFHIWAKRLRQRVVGLEPVVHTIVNEFFGATVTAAGLLTAEDIARQTSDLQGEDFLIPQLMLKAGTRIFLDDRDVDWLSGQIQGRAIVVENEGRSFLEGLLGSKLEV